jgi:transcription elongation factor GreA
MSNRYPFTPDGFKKAKERLKYLKEVKRPEIITAIETAREHGDLKENAEYHAAKDLQGFTEAEVRRLDAMLSRAEVIDPKTLSGDRVLFSATVVVYDPDQEEEFRYQIVGMADGDPRQGRISYQSPIARALTGREVGDEVEIKLPGGVRTLEILEVLFE